MVIVTPDAPTAVQMDLYKGTNVSAPTPADYAAAKEGKKTWRLLKQKHECYEERALDVRKQDLLYQGGFQMNKPEVAQLFCPKLKNEEGKTDYNERVGAAAYVPTFSKLITGLISNLFSQDLAVMEAADHDDPTTAGEDYTDHLRDYYKLFQGDCDGNGTTLHNFVRRITTKALIHSFTYFGVDYPKGQADNLLEQEKMGLDKPRLYCIDSESVFDWTFVDGSDHEFKELKLVSCDKYQPTLFDPVMYQYTVKRWYLNEESVACYECFQSDPLPLGKEPKDKDVLAKVDEGTTSFKHIPIFYVCLDEGIAVGKKLAPLAAEHFNRTTIENHSTNKACLTIPVIYRGEMLPSDGSLPSPIAFDNERGQHPRGKVNSKGVVELGMYTQDRLEIVEAEGKALGFIHKQNEDLDEKMHSVVHQMGQSLKQARSQSGKTALSKQEDRHATEMLLTAIADEIYSVTQRVFETISESRGEDIIWDVRGLSALSIEDRDELTKEAAALDSIAIPSLTFKKEYHYRLASRLIEGTDQRTLHTIRGEIEEGLDTLNVTTTVGGVQVPGDPASKVNALGGSDASLNSGASSKRPSGSKKPGEGSEVAVGQEGEQTGETMALGPAGQPLLPDGAHLQTGEHIDSQVVYDQLAEDYQEKDIQWVLHVPWIGPVEVPLSAIDFSNKDNWQASEDDTKVDQFADKMANDGFTKPIILANNPSNDNKMMVIDGHHRALAAMQNGTPVSAYVAQVGANRGPWDKLHSKQVGSKQASLASNQKTEDELTKEVSNQVNKSEKAKGGMTK